MSEVKRHDPIQGAIVHEYDGIEEADNHLPLWWLWTFYAAVLFSIGYWFYYEEFEAAPGLQGQYFADKAAAALKSGKEPSGEELLAMIATPAKDRGKQTFTTMCAACHEANGQGKIGPNLTDDAWIHGGSEVEIYHTIKNGVPEKGMPAWGVTLGPLTTQEVTAFVLSLRNTNVPGKAPEGTPYAPKATSAGNEATAPVPGAPQAAPAEPEMAAAGTP